jgi:hypothetical protein
VCEVAKTLKRVSQDLIRAFTADLRDEADAARVVFKIRRVKGVPEMCSMILNYVIHSEDTLGSSPDVHGRVRM